MGLGQHLAQVWRSSALRHRVLLCLVLLQAILWYWVEAELLRAFLSLFGLGLLVIVAVEMLGAWSASSKSRPLLLAASCLALGSCAGERYIFMRDLDLSRAEIDRASCADVRQIFASGQGLGRSWQHYEMATPSMHSAPARPGRVIHLYLFTMPSPDGQERYQLEAGSWLDDDLFAGIDCPAGKP